jgi:hydrogenase maturation protein HypF
MILRSGKNIRIQVRGLVQGVGFRPFVYRSARKHFISGWVRNSQEGVLIEATGTSENLELFTSDLKNNYPPVARILDLQITDSGVSYDNGFEIILSENTESGCEITQIGPDIAVCPDCLEDMKVQKHRIEYPFINCTNCGPRFSIIRDLPYDRQKTTMDAFKMCPVCKAEYDDPSDRRFHAQPVACLSCGPHYRFVSKNRNSEIPPEVLTLTAEFINMGKSVAIKGIGGFFIACDAGNERSVKKLRKRKRREGKPFAVMFRDIEAIRQFCFLSNDEKEILDSWHRPIVILHSRKLLPESVSNGLSTIGALLPYMPFHYLLFDKLQTSAIIFTSGNLSDEPILISDEEAIDKLSVLSDAIVTYNREIYNRTDDSVVRVIAQTPRLFRRSRGFAPNPVLMTSDVDGILAVGPELKNTFCLGKGKQAILSQHIGDLKDYETYTFFERNIAQLQKMFRIRPELVACDLHPQYLSSKYAADSGLPVEQVQHHHAHIASAMAENKLDEKVIGISWDGTGLGDDGNIWGSEFLTCDLTGYERHLHFDYVALPGGDLAIQEPWRIAVSYLYKFFERDFLDYGLPFLKNINPDQTDNLFKAIDNHINCPLSCGAGRLFDAVSVLTGLCIRPSFEAEAPMRLEDAASDHITASYPYIMSEVIDFSEMFYNIIQDLAQKTDPGIISARFHNTLTEIIVSGAERISRSTGIRKVVLSGGTFQNRYLLTRTENLLASRGLEVFCNCSVPCNDGGISLGQLAVAAKRRNKANLN